MLREGESVRIVGSHNHWLEDVGPRCVLLLAVDDAAGVVANAVFPGSGRHQGYFTLIEGLTRSWEIPLALYGDHHGVFQFSGQGWAARIDGWTHT